MDKKHEHAGSDELSIPIMPVAILLAALILSGTIYYSATVVTGNLNEMKTAIIAASQNRTGPNPTPTPGQITCDQVVKGVIPSDSARPIRGAANAPVTIIEYSDYECPFCGRAEPTLTQLFADYPGKIKLIYKNYPLPFHTNAQKAAEAAECAADQGKFWEMHDILYANSDALDIASLKGYAQELGLDTAVFNACLDCGAKTALVDADLLAGEESGVSGTPTFIINGKMVVGAQPIDAFKTEIDAILEAG